MQNKTFLSISIILNALLWLYFYNYGFSRNFWIRYGQYFSVIIGIYYILEEWFRPGD